MEKSVTPAQLRRYPLLTNQKRLWIISQQDKNNPGYNLVITYHFNGEIDRDILQKSLQHIFERQQGMFSVFKQTDGTPYLEIVPRKVEVEYKDFSGLPEPARRPEILQFAGLNARTCFDLEQGPLYRLFLFKENTDSYYFHACIHHLIFDGWSMRLFIQEIEKTYNAFTTGKGMESESQALQSFDFEVTEERAISADDEKAMAAFWKSYLKDCPPELRFPLDHQRRDAPSGFGHYEPFRIPESIATKLGALAQQNKTSVFKTVLTALGILLHKYSSDTDICIGIPISTRRQYPGLDHVFGMFVDTSVARLIIDDTSSFKDFLSHSNESINLAIKNSRFTFGKIVETINPERILNKTPLFQVALSWWNNVTVPLELGSIKGERISIPKGVSPFDITFYLWEKDNFIDGEIAFSTDILEHDTIHRLKNNFLELLEKLTSFPTESIGSIAVISKEEKEKVLSFTRTRTDYPRDKTIVDLFEEEVDLQGDKPAVIYQGKSLSYLQLNRQANQLANLLRDLGVTANTPVGIVAEKSLELITGILGIIKSGGCYVPIDPDFPRDRIQFILNDSGCKFILAQSGRMISGPDDVSVIEIDDKKLEGYPAVNPVQINKPSDLAYIMYTSGTTGVPKGSMIMQSSVIRLIRNTNYIHLTPQDKILLTGAIVFDATTFEIWGALLNGAELYLVDKNTILAPNALGKELLDNDITTLWLTSPLFTQIAENRTDIFRKLKYLLVGGDVLSVSHINKVRIDNPQLQVINGYGPTENTTFSTAYLVAKHHENTIPIGKPISNSTAYIFNKQLQLQPIGVIGELYVGGDGLSKGYLNRDDLNASCFLENPYNKGERLYKTGDYASWLPDGNILFHGRIDNQLKLRGYRVELEEIESVIAEIDGIVETVVKPFTVEGGETRLVAFINVSESHYLDDIQLAKQVKGKLPSYMVPSVYKIMRGFPKTINGKTDRNALQYDFSSEWKAIEPEISSLRPTEKIIHEIWCDTLKVASITRYDNFFDIGGNSLNAIAIMSKLEKAFQVEINLRVFFDSPKIMDLADAIEVAKYQSSTSRKDIPESPAEKRIVKGEL